MNAAELKLDMFRKIDEIKDSELQNIYNKFLAILNTRSPYSLSEKEKIAIDEAIQSGNRGELHTSEEVMEEARRKYPNLKFK